MKPRVAVLIYSLAAGGAERVVSLLLPKLTKHYEVTLVLMNETLFYPVPENVEICYLERSRPDEPGWKKLCKLPLLAWRYRTLLQRRKIALSLSLMTRPNYINILAKRLGSEARTLISERSHFSSQYADASLSSRVNRFLVHLYDSADLIVSNSLGNRIDLQERFALSAPMETIYNPVDLEAVGRCVTQEVEVLRRDPFVFVSVGRMDEGKNQRLLLEAIREIDAELWLIGDGPLREELEHLSRVWGIADRVRFLGRRKNPFAYMARADAFVFASRHEGFPNVLIEALACELPIISTDCPSGPREIFAPDSDPRQSADGVEYAEYGVLVPIDDRRRMREAMEVMMKNDTIRHDYVQKARRRAEDFSIKKILPEWEEVLRRELSRKP